MILLIYELSKKVTLIQIIIEEVTKSNMSSMIGTGTYDISEEEVLKLMHDKDMSYIEAVAEIENNLEEKYHEKEMEDLQRFEEEECTRHDMEHTFDGIGDYDF